MIVGGAHERERERALGFERFVWPKACASHQRACMRDDVCSHERFRAGAELRAGGCRPHGRPRPEEGVQEGQDTAKPTSCQSVVGEAP